MDIQQFFELHRERVNEQLLSRVMAYPCASEKLLNAIRHSLFAGGKRLRPALVYASAACVGNPTLLSDAAACAVELVHTYSLVHDDLPAMDDDDLRRGKPTCHKAFDEATAILAGDAMQAMAFEVLSGPVAGHADTALQLEMIAILSRAAGANGMVGGQALDLESVGIELDQPALEAMHQCKTGALIAASVELGALSGGTLDDTARSALATFSSAIGLGFQIRDDILDVEGSTAVLGKQQGSDQQQDKPTYPSMLGMQGAREAADLALESALESIAFFGASATPLRELAQFVIGRDR